MHSLAPPRAFTRHALKPDGGGGPFSFEPTKVIHAALPATRAIGVAPCYAIAAGGRWLLSGGHADCSLRCTSLISRKPGSAPQVVRAHQHWSLRSLSPSYHPSDSAGAPALRLHNMGICHLVITPQVVRAYQHCGVITCVEVGADGLCVLTGATDGKLTRPLNWVVGCSPVHQRLRPLYMG